MKVPSSAWNPILWVVDLTNVWRDTRLVVLIAQIAAIYAAILIPFKVGIPLIPGFAELRPANAIPIVASLLFGPAAAWGAGLGNIIGDCFGSLGPASVFGFLGNFFFGYVPYVLWGNMGLLSSRQPPQVKSWRQGLEFGIVCVVASGVCAGIIGWGVQLLGLLPFMILAPAIFLNNMVMGFLLGPPLLLFLYPRVARWGLLYRDFRKDVMWMDDPRSLRSSVSPQQPIDHQKNTRVPIVDICDLTFRYKSEATPTLHHLSLQISQGETVVLMGRGGSGKSTLCFTLNGLIPHYVSGDFSGVVRINGQDTRHNQVWQQAGKVGLVFQDFETQLVSTNVETELAFALEYLDPPLAPNKMAQRIQWALEEVGLTSLERCDPLALSGGQRQRLVMASLLASQPGLLVLDQPMTDLDPEARTQLRTLFAKLRQEGITILVTEQESEGILQADRICVLHEGAVTWDGPPRALFSQPNMAEEHGIRPLDLAQSFMDLDVPVLPVTVEDAWRCVDEWGLTFDPPHFLLEEENIDDHRQGNSGNPQASPLLNVEEVSFHYEGEVKVLENISFSISPGEFVAVVGKNGCGKSTLAKLFNGLLLPSNGHVFVAGQDTRVVTVSELAKSVGYVFQNPDHQIFAETVWEEVAFSARNIGCSQEECDQRVQDALAAVGLDWEMSRFQDPFSLTKGERQRVAVASVLAAKPNLLVFDEPTTGLDAAETDRMMEMIRLLNRNGHTIVIITHSMGLVAKYASRCLLMNRGHVVGDGPTRKIFAKPELLESCSLNVPPLTQFSQRWGYTLLTIPEVKASLKKK